MNYNDESPYRVILIGDSFVGKTSIVMRFITKAFTMKQEETIGISYFRVQISLPYSQVTLQIWDTAGQEKYKSLGPIYYREADAAIFVYDSTNLQTFSNIDSWRTAFKSVTNGNVPCFLIGNKFDLADENQVSIQKASEYANLHNMTFMETSAKNGFNIDNLFITIASNLQEQDFEQSNKEPLLNEKEKSTSCSC